MHSAQLLAYPLRNPYQMLNPLPSQLPSPAFWKMRNIAALREVVYATLLEMDTISPMWYVSSLAW